MENTIMKKINKEKEKGKLIRLNKERAIGKEMRELNKGIFGVLIS